MLAAASGPTQRDASVAAALQALGSASFFGALALYMLLSAPALAALGIPYEATGGPPFAKLHPGSYMLLAAWACLLLARGNPLRTALHGLRRQPLVGACGAGMGLVFVWVMLRHGSSGAAYIVQTLCMPPLALFALDLLAPPRRRQALQLVMLLLCCNAVLALGEYASGRHLLAPPPEQLGVQHFRASALLGHPLLNANVTMALLPGVLLMPWRLPLRLAAAALLVASVLAFGARTALFVGLLVYGTQAALYGAWNLVHGRYGYLQLTGGLAALCVAAALAAGVVLATGLGERIFQSLVWDNSADVRLRVWGAFDYLRGADFWFGLAPARIDDIALALGLDPRYEAIENFWIYAFLQFGLIGFVPFAAALGCLVLHLWRAGTPALRSALLVYFVIASSANTLSSKTVSLTLLAVMVMAAASVQRQRRRHAAREVRR